jgi:peptide deformylase
MSVKDIITIWEHPETLAAKAKDLSKADILSSTIQTLIEHMKDTCHAVGGLGLAACQIGAGANLFIYTVPGESGYKVLINPEIVMKKDLYTSKGEGCLSVPETYFNVKRYKKIRVTGLDEYANPVDITTKSKQLATAVGLSFLSQSLKSLEYNNQYGNNTARDYYRNPLFRLNSKYWHYRPKGAVVITKHQWQEIEKNIGIKIDEAKRKGVKLGRKSLYIDIQDAVKEKQAVLRPTSPYAILNVKANAPMAEIEARYKWMMEAYNPNNFVDLDKAFIQLAEIRCEQIEKAWKQINYGISYSKGDI